MLRENILDLMSFLVVARERSFTKAASQLGVSQSALSHSMRGLEERLGTRLLTRTTRSVAPTQAGEHLIEEITPLLLDMQDKVETVNQYTDQPAGQIRLTTVDYAVQYILWPKLRKFLMQYPDIDVEINVDYGLIDIVKSRFDAGVRLGEHLAKDMIAVKIGPELRMAVVAAPSYFENYQKPVTLHDLNNHSCINLRLPTSGGLYPWEFDTDEREVKIRVKGRLIFNTYPQIITAVLDGFGLAYIPEEQVLPYLQTGELVRVLDEYCLPFPGYYLYYPSRRHHTVAFNLLIDALRHRG